MSNKVELPHNEAAERAVIGACILSKDALNSAITTLKTDDFYDFRFQNIFETISQMYFNGEIVDLVTVSDKLSARGMYDRFGGQELLTELLSSTTSTRNIKGHVNIVHEYSMRRRILASAETLKRFALDFDTPTPDIIKNAEKLLFETGQNRSSSEVILLREVLLPTLSDIGDRNSKTGANALTGYPTHYPDLDKMTGGLQPGSLNIIAARPSMGKTALAMNIAQFGGNDNDAVVIFSLEMPSSQIVQRMLAAQAEVNLTAIMRGTLSTEDFQKVKAAADILSQKQIYINDATQLSAVEFRARCRRFKSLHPNLALVIVDYLQLMSASDKRTEGRQQEVSDISRMLKAAARDINCPVIALSQLSREAEKRTDKKPQLADLRDSGAIEQDADLVMMLYREDYYTDHEASDLTYSKADIRVAKNRNGSTGTCSLTFKRELTLFTSYQS